MAGIWETERLIFVAPEEEHEAFLHTNAADGYTFLNLSPFLAVPQGKKDDKDGREWLANKTLMGAIVCLKPEPKPETSEEDDTKDEAKPKPKPIGHIALMGEENPRQQYHRHAEIGLGFEKPYRGKGYGTEAIYWALNWGFQIANLHRISIGAISKNEGAIRLYQKLGFVQEGRMRDFFWVNGAYADCYHFSMLEDEYRSKFLNKSSDGEASQSTVVSR